MLKVLKDVKDQLTDLPTCPSRDKTRYYEFLYLTVYIVIVLNMSNLVLLWVRLHQSGECCLTVCTHKLFILQIDDKKTRKLVYPEHLPLTKIQAGLKSGKYLQVYSHPQSLNAMATGISSGGMDKLVRCRLYLTYLTSPTDTQRQMFGVEVSAAYVCP